MADETRVSIDGMHCDHCEVTVGAALTEAGLSDVSVDWRRGEAFGIADSKFSAQDATDGVARSLLRRKETSPAVNERKPGVGPCHPHGRSHPDHSSCSGGCPLFLNRCVHAAVVGASPGFSSFAGLVS
jgi:copper chaperone CopZ